MPRNMPRISCKPWSCSGQICNLILPCENVNWCPMQFIAIGLWLRWTWIFFLQITLHNITESVFVFGMELKKTSNYKNWTDQDSWKPAIHTQPQHAMNYIFYTRKYVYTTQAITLPAFSFHSLLSKTYLIGLIQGKGFIHILKIYVKI